MPGPAVKQPYAVERMPVAEYLDSKHARACDPRWVAVWRAYLGAGRGDAGLAAARALGHPPSFTDACLGLPSER